MMFWLALPSWLLKVPIELGRAYVSLVETRTYMDISAKMAPKTGFCIGFLLYVSVYKCSMDRFEIGAFHFSTFCVKQNEIPCRVSNLFIFKYLLNLHVFQSFSVPASLTIISSILYSSEKSVVILI